MPPPTRLAHSPALSGISALAFAAGDCGTRPTAGASALPITPFFAGRSRPLCTYPTYARDAGTGSLEDGANFTCAPQ
jgi:hypothetical protein